MDKITLAYLIGETSTAIDHAHAIRTARETSYPERIIASLTLTMFEAEFDALLPHYLFFFPETESATREDVREWARQYCTEHPDLLAQVDERLRAERSGGNHA